MIVSGLAEAGADVVVHGRNQARCEAAAEDIARATGREAVGFACDVADWDSIAGLVAAVMDRFGRIDVLVNNAGINPAGSHITDLSRELVRKVMAVNFEGPLRLCQLVAPIMRDGGGGSIINIASVGGLRGGTRVGVYGASKAALINATQTMAQEWAPWNVRVNSLSPGPVHSDMTAGAQLHNPRFLENVARSTMQGRVADPIELVGPVVYLAGEAASYVTGENHVVSGGSLGSGG